jgi:hypothetical protein
MQCSVTVTVEIGPVDGIDQVEEQVLQAGREAMRRALGQAVRCLEESHLACARCASCGSQRMRSHGTVPRVVLTRFGRVELGVRRVRCRGCGKQVRPASPCLAPLGAANVTPQLAAACALAGASWAYATAARVLHTLSGAQVSAEEVRRLTIAAGTQEAAAQRQEAERLVAPTADDVRAERERAPSPPEPAQRLVVGLDGGWVPSREQAGGMEGKVGVVASGAEPVGKQGRHRLTPRRYIATFESSARVGLLAYAAATDLGAAQACEQFVLGDGASWIHTQADLHFPDAVGILDWSHVERALHQAIRAACPGRPNRARRREFHRAIPAVLWHGDIDGTLAALVALRPSAPGADPIARLEEAITYLTTQRAWLGNYAAWQAAGYPVGSGLIERAVALVINRRMKRQGMRWRRGNASAVAALRVREFNVDGGGRDDEDLSSPLAA